MNNSIYDRNTREWGQTNQEKLLEHRVLIIGSDILAQYLAGGLAGLGVGSLALMDNTRVTPDQYNIFVHQQGKRRVDGIAQALDQLNPLLTIDPVFSAFNRALIYQYQPTICIDASNCSRQKEQVLQYALDKNISFFSAVSNHKGCLVSRINTPTQDIHASYDNTRQHPVSSGIAAGIVLEEIRKLTFRYPDNLYDTKLHANCTWSYDTKHRPLNLSQTRALVIGAGAIGTYVTLSLALLGCKEIHIHDHDEIECTNLNRQLLYYGMVGQKKVQALKQRLSHLSSSHIRASTQRIGRLRASDHDWVEEYRVHDESPLSFEAYSKEHFGSMYPNKLNDMDIVFGCVDNKYARKWLDVYTQCAGLPYVDGGTAPQLGQCAVMHHGTPRLDDYLMLKYAPVRNSCIDGPNPSVIMSNMVVGNVMVHQGIRTLQGYDVPAGLTRYDITSPQRLFFVPQA
jgi:molybdopterin/thiamine biosynthesis adenylyltransferase